MGWIRRFGVDYLRSRYASCKPRHRVRILLPEGRGFLVDSFGVGIAKIISKDEQNSLNSTVPPHTF